jgi:hypothetical protein
MITVNKFKSILYYTFNKKVLYPGDKELSEFDIIQNIIGELVSYENDIYFISFVNSNELNINSDLLKSPGVPYELINKKQIESCMNKQPFDIKEKDLFWSKNNMLSKEFYEVILNDMVVLGRDFKIKEILK